MYQPISVKGAMRAMCHATNTDFATVAVLSPERKRRCVERLVNMKPMALRTPREAKKRSAVLVPLVDVRGQTCLLYTKRANNIRLQLRNSRILTNLTNSHLLNTAVMVAR